MIMLLLIFRWRIWWNGFKRKQVKCDGFFITYINRGNLSMYTPSILFLHGFSLRKENWIDMMNNIPSKFHVVALDLPGHGESEFNNKTFDTKHFAKIIKIVRNKILRF